MIVLRSIYNLSIMGVMEGISLRLGIPWQLVNKGGLLYLGSIVFEFMEGDTNIFKGKTQVI